MRLEEGSGLCFLRRYVMQLLGLVGKQCDFFILAYFLYEVLKY